MLFGCGNREDTEVQDTEKTIDEIIEERLGKTMPFDEMPDTLQVAHMVRIWNGFHNSKFIDQLGDLYANPLFFYGKDRLRYEALDIKKNVFHKYPDYFQRVIGSINIRRISGNQYKAEFTKYVRVGDLTAPVPSYLIFQKTGENKWVIIAESDPKTDIKTKELEDSIQTLINIYTPSSELISGRFSGPTLDSAFIFSDDNQECINCTTSIFFTNDILPPLEIRGVKTAQLFNEGDLDGDGREEFSVLTKINNEGWISIYSYKRGEWKILYKFKVRYEHLLRDVDARQDAVQLAGSGYIYVQKLEGDTTIQEKVNIWNVN